MSAENIAKGDKADFLNTAPSFDFSDPKVVHDRIFLIEDKKFHVSSGLLSVWSEYFNGIFGSEFADANMKEIKIEEVSAEDFEKFLLFIYPIPYKITETNVSALIKMSHRFLVPGVMVECMKFIDANYEKTLAHSNIFDLLEIALQFGMNDLKKKIGNFFFASPEVAMGNRCAFCSFTNKSAYCTHNKMGTGIYCNKLINENKERIASLSNEAQSFIIQASVKNF